jgi:hypothetical protein
MGVLRVVYLWYANYIVGMTNMAKVFIVSILFFFAMSGVAVAAVPETNRMQLGEISDSLPVAEMRTFYAKMEPLMREIFGPPFSNVNLKIEANLNGTVHDTGYLNDEQTLVLAGQAKVYQEEKTSNPKHALEQIYGNMLHELSHGMYYYGNSRVTFHPQWVNEGWVKLQEILLAGKLNFYSFGIQPYFDYYLDRDTIAGTTNWGSSKQSVNHGIVYNVTSDVHLTMLALSSNPEDGAEFYKVVNNKVYDWVKATGQTDISLEQYKSIMRELLAGKTIDGQPAFDWYFNNPDSLTQGRPGDHLGITVEQKELVAYTFKRSMEGEDIQETGLPNTAIKITVTNYDDKVLLEKAITTDADGNARVDMPKNENFAIMTLEAASTINGKSLIARSFYFNAPQGNKLSGVLVDEAGKPLPAKYVGLLKSDLAFEYKNKGVFLMSVPSSTRTVTLDFMGYKQEVTKGPFARMFAMTVPAKYVEVAGNQPDQAFKNGIVDNRPSVMDSFNLTTTQRKQAFIVGIVSIAAVVISAIFILRPKKVSK